MSMVASPVVKVHRMIAVKAGLASSKLNPSVKRCAVPTTGCMHACRTLLEQEQRPVPHYAPLETSVDEINAKSCISE